MTMHTHHGSAAPPVLSTLVESHREFLAFLQRRVGDRELAEDILQSAFVRASERVGQLHDDESAVAWFYRMLRNAVVDHLRSRGASERKIDALARELDDATEPAPELERAICRCIGELVDTLDPSYAHALRRIELDGVPVKTFAEEAGITANNAGVRVHRARAALRKQVARCCGTCAEHGCEDCSCAR